MTTSIPLLRSFASTVPHGSLEITQRGDSKRVTYHNAIYKGSPFEMPTSFNAAFSDQKILDSVEVRTFVHRITGGVDRPVV